MKNIKKEDVINMSYNDIAYLILNNNEGGINTLDLFTNIIDLLELSKDTIDTQIADFYTSLTTDKRFLLVDGMWDLRTRHTSDKLLFQMDDEEDDEESIEESDEDMENENDSYTDAEDLDDTNYDDTDDDGLSDLVVLNEDEIDTDN